MELIWRLQGKRPKGEYSSFDAVNLSSHPIGAQSLYGKLFLLSVEEAVKYKEFLWTFEGAQEENPETQLSSFSKGYWLRTPMGTGDGADMGYVYGVDLEQGQIRPGTDPADGRNRRCGAGCDVAFWRQASLCDAAGLEKEEETD